MLTFGELYPPLRRDPRLSRIGDMEMMRIQIEASAALADCLRLRREDPRRYFGRLRAALDQLPMPWRRTHDRWAARVLEGAAEHFAVVADGPDELTLDKLQASGWPLPLGDPDRVEANALLNGAYRNASGIEDVHAGAWSAATEVPGYFRLYASEVQRVARRFADALAIELAARARLKPEARAAVNAIRAPSTWTTTHETAIVGFAGLAGGRALDDRLSILAARYPTAYTTRRLDGSYDSGHRRFVPAAGTATAPSVLLDGTAHVLAQPG
jgi:hypothetical protein